MSCQHETWEAFVAVSNLADQHGSTLDRRAIDLRINCARCGVALQFVGMPAGLSVLWPTVSVDGLEARLNAVPEGTVMSPLAEFAAAFPPPKEEQH